MPFKFPGYCRLRSVKRRKIQAWSGSGWSGTGWGGAGWGGAGWGSAVWNIKYIVSGKFWKGGMGRK